MPAACEVRVGGHADADDDEVRRDDGPVLQFEAWIRIRCLSDGMRIQLELDALRAVIGRHVLRDRGAERARHDARRELDDRHVAVAQRRARGDFHSDDASAEQYDLAAWLELVPYVERVLQRA